MTGESRKSQFVRLGYEIGAPRFLVQCDDAAVFRQCVRAAGDHGTFRAEHAARVLGELFPEFRRIDVGREASPVIYVCLARPPGPGGPPESPEVLHQRRLAADAARKLHAGPVRELRDGNGQITRVRLHWD